MKFNDWYINFDETNGEATAGDGWRACKKEILKAIKNTKAPKVPGMEGLGGYSWEDMGAETFRQILIEKIEKL